MDKFDRTQNICRVCLVENDEEIQCVFDKIYSTAEPMKLSEMLMICAKVEIIAGDQLSDKICYKCARNTIKLYSFKTKCEESDKTLRNRLNVIDKIVVHEEAEAILDRFRLEVKKENVEAFDCVQQNENNPLETVVYEDYDACNESTKYSESNTFNTSQQNDLSHRKKVAEIAHQIKMIDKKLDSQTHEVNEDKNTCHDSVGATLKSLVIRLEDYNQLPTLKEEEYNAVSDESTKSSSLAKYDFVASGKNQYECDTCKITFSRFVSLARHECRRHQHTKKKTGKSSLVSHEHRGKKRYKCDICKKKFFVKGQLIYHKRMHIGEKPYKCEVCEREYKSSNSLQMHRRTHTGEKPYTCDVCEKKFMAKGILVKHKRIHTGEKPYECDICEKKFAQSGNLLLHKRTHTGEKPSECDICKRKFASSNALIYHKRRHTGEKPHECDVCKKKYVSPSALRNHKRTHTGDKRHQCDICEKKFYVSSALMAHKRIH